MTVGTIFQPPSQLPLALGVKEVSTVLYHAAWLRSNLRCQKVVPTSPTCSLLSIQSPYHEGKENIRPWQSYMLAASVGLKLRMGFWNVFQDKQKGFWLSGQVQEVLLASSRSPTANSVLGRWSHHTKQLGTYGIWGVSPPLSRLYP